MEITRNAGPPVKSRRKRRTTAIKVKHEPSPSFSSPENLFCPGSVPFQDLKTLNPGGWPRPPVNYCILIALALRSSLSGSLKVQQIYHFTRSGPSPASNVVPNKSQVHGVSFAERTSPSFRRLLTAGRTPSDTTCASTAASAKPAIRCAGTGRGSPVFGT